MAKGRKPVNRQFVRTLALTTALLPAICLAQSSQDHVTRIDYYPNGLVSSTTLPDGSFTSYVYDAAQRLTDIVDAEGNSIHYTLDNAGNRVKEEVKGEGGTLRRTLSRVYNQLGQLQTVKDASSHPTGFTYDANGNLDTTTDALGRVADNDYDPLNRLSKTIQDLGGISATTQFKYDAQDNLTEVVDPKGLSTKHQYNAFGNLVRLESPDTGVTVYGYDSAGNRTSALDARGELSTYTFDALNRLTAIVYSDATLNVSYIYDTVQPECEPFESFAVGRLTRMTDGSGETRYCHDRFGGMTRKVQVTNGSALTVRYSYSSGGRLSAVQYPDGMVVDYVRDHMGRASEVGVTIPGEPRKTLITAIKWHPFGTVSRWTYGNGRALTRMLDLDYRPTIIQSSGSGAGGLDVQLSWDEVGNLSAIEGADNGLPAAVAFDYDGLNRLVALKDGNTGSVIEGYGYDPTGNRVSSSNANGNFPYSYLQNSHQLSAIGNTQRTYDSRGNTVSIGGTAREFVYNAAGRMSEVRRSGAVAASYSYSGSSERVAKRIGEVETITIFDKPGQWLGEYNDRADPIQQVIWIDHFPIGLVSGGVLYYIEPDHLGTPRTVIDPARDVAVWTWDLASEAFGASGPDEDRDADGQKLVLNMRYAGQLFDQATGLNHNYYRDYDAEAGRYIESDPIGLIGGISTYGYVGGSPLTGVDPLGLARCKQIYETVNIGPVDERRTSLGTPLIEEQCMLFRVVETPTAMGSIPDPMKMIRRQFPLSLPIGIARKCRNKITKHVLVETGYARDTTYWEVCYDECEREVSRTFITTIRNMDWRDGRRQWDEEYGTWQFYGTGENPQ